MRQRVRNHEPKWCGGNWFFKMPNENIKTSNNSFRLRTSKKSPKLNILRCTEPSHWQIQGSPWIKWVKVAWKWTVLSSTSSLRGASGLVPSPDHMEYLWNSPDGPRKWIGLALLVGGWATPLKNIRIWKSVGVTIANIWKNEIHVPNHQPAYNSYNVHSLLPLSILLFIGFGAWRSLGGWEGSSPCQESLEIFK